MGRREVQKHLASGFMQELASRVGAQHAFVSEKTREKEGKPELITTSDRGELNSASEKDAYPVEDTVKILEFLASTKIYSAVDMRDGYHIVRLREADMRLTVVNTLSGFVEYT